MARQVAAVLLERSRGGTHHRLGRQHIGRLQIALRLQRLGLRRRGGYVGLRLRDQGAIVVIDDLRQELTGAHVLEVLHRQLADIPGYLGRDRGHVRLQVGIIRGLPLGVPLPVIPPGDDHDQNDDGNDENRSPPNDLAG